MEDGAVIVISSHVARGSVGNRAMVFALERLGFTVWAVPTVILPHTIPGTAMQSESCLMTAHSPACLKLW